MTAWARSTERVRTVGDTAIPDCQTAHQTLATDKKEVFKRVFAQGVPRRSSSVRSTLAAVWSTIPRTVTLDHARHKYSAASFCEA